ncbi:hypothetical protein [Diplocloster modestus]|nr:hypothetical protein [Diplocloster modestus]
MEIVRLSVRYFHGYAMNQTAYGMLVVFLYVRKIARKKEMMKE